MLTCHKASKGARHGEFPTSANKEDLELAKIAHTPTGCYKAFAAASPGKPSGRSRSPALAHRLPKHLPILVVMKRGRRSRREWDGVHAIQLGRLVMSPMHQLLRLQPPQRTFASPEVGPVPTVSEEEGNSSTS